MLSEKNRQICLDTIQSAINYCNHDLITFKNKKVSIEYSIKNDIRINAKSILIDYFNDSYSVQIYSEVFEKTFDILNMLLYEGNKDFYAMVSFDNVYNKIKANAYLDIMHVIISKLIIYHELGHIYNGHLRYIYNNKLTKECSMFMDSDENNLPPIVSQTLEMDADAFSATRGIGQITYKPNIIEINKITSGLIKNKEHALMIFIISSCVLFSIQGLGKSREKSDIKQIKYLPLRTRQDNYMRCALNAFKFLNPEAKLLLGKQKINIEFLREILPNIEQWVNLCIREYLGFTKYDYDYNNNAEEMSKDYINHCKFLDDFWDKTMTKQLLPYSYFELY